VGGKFALTAATALKVFEAGLAVKLICEQEQQFAALSSPPSERDQERFDL
jgi:hypothetical protein